MKTINCIIVLLLSVFSISFCQAQQAQWFVGVWRGGAAATKKSTAQNIQITFHIIKVEGDAFEGMVKLTLLSDTSIHSDSKVTGTIHRNYMSAKIGENVYKKDPPGGRWETRCGICGPIQFTFRIKEGRFIMTGETKDCLQQCNGVSVYSRSLDDFDPVARASMVALVNGEQPIVEDEQDSNATDAVAKSAVKNNTADEKSIAYKSIDKALLEVTAVNKKETKYSPTLRVDATHAKGVSIKEDETVYYPPVVRTDLTVVPVEKKENPLGKPGFNVDGRHAEGVKLKEEPFVYYPPVERSLLVVTPLPIKQLPSIKKVVTTPSFRAPVVVKVPPPSKLVQLAEKLNKPANAPAAVSNTITKKQEKAASEPLRPPKGQTEEAVAKKNTSAPVKSADSLLIKKQDQRVVKTKPSVDSVVTAKKEVYEKREMNIVKAFDVTTDSITLRLFDNGIVDGDTVSVFNNDAIIISRIGLTSHAFEIKIPVDKTNDNKIVMYAHNLGEIPPNTALMEIYSGKQMYSLLITSDLQKSSGIVLNYKQE